MDSEAVKPCQMGYFTIHLSPWVALFLCGESGVSPPNAYEHVRYFMHNKS